MDADEELNKSLSNEGNSESDGKNGNKNDVVVKIGLVGDAQVGKTTLMVKYVENKFDEDYIQTLGKSSNVSLQCMCRLMVSFCQLSPLSL